MQIFINDEFAQQEEGEELECAAPVITCLTQYLLIFEYRNLKKNAK